MCASSPPKSDIIFDVVIITTCSLRHRRRRHGYIHHRFHRFSVVPQNESSKIIAIVLINS